MEAQLLECSRNATGKEVRHLTVMDDPMPLCGSHERQSKAGAGRWSLLLHWPTCKTCKGLAVRMGPRSEQAD